MTQTITLITWHFLTETGQHEFHTFTNREYSGFMRRKENKKRYLSKSKLVTLTIKIKKH